MKEAMFYEKQKDKFVKCGICARRCLISEGQRGFCRVRENQKGKLFSLNYGKLCSIGIDPIQKKPFFHFAPGTQTLSIATMGCNFRCKFCCNWQISQEREIKGINYTPEQVVKEAIAHKCQGISYTYTEPTIFAEFAHDTSKTARKKGLYNCWVTNGYTTLEAIKEISKYLDAVAVDFKGSANPKFYKEFSQVPNVQPIFDALLAYKKNKVFLEVTDLLIPKIGYNLDDIKKLCRWVVENLGKETPVHFISFFPSYKLDIPATPTEALEKAYIIAKEQGLQYVYLGNVPGHKYESTYCPECNNLLIERAGIQVTRFLLKKDLKCPKCGERMSIAGKNWIPKELWKK